MGSLTIGKVAKRTACNIETIRYYEKEGLLPEPERTDGGHRLYTEPLVRRLVFIRRSRDLGFKMDDVRQLLALVDKSHVSCKQVKAIADSHILNIKSKLEDLRKMEKILLELSGLCSGRDIPNCPIIDALSDD